MVIVLSEYQYRQTSVNRLHMDLHVLQSHATSACKRRGGAGDHIFYGTGAFGSAGGILSLRLPYIGRFCFADPLGLVAPSRFALLAPLPGGPNQTKRRMGPLSGVSLGCHRKKKKDTVVRGLGTFIQVRSFGRSGLVAVLCNFEETEEPSGCWTGSRDGLVLGMKPRKRVQGLWRGGHRRLCAKRPLHRVVDRKGKERRITVHPRLGVSRRVKRPNYL